MTPRDFQSAAMANVGREFRAGKRAVLVVSPTGSGKTCMGAMMAERFVLSGKRVAWGAHRGELLDQAGRTLRSFGLEVGRDGKGASTPVQLGTFQQWTSRGQCPDADVLVVDEAHHMGDRVGWQMIPKTYREKGARIIGLTATPARADGRALPDFDAIVVAAQIHELQARGLLVPLKGSGPKQERADLLAQRRALSKRPVDAYLQRAKGRCAVCFSPNTRSAEQHCAEFVEAGVRARVVRGDMREEERRIALEQHADGRIDVLVNVAVLTEGWDNPRCDCVIVARGCESVALWIQMVGRGLRPYEGKADCLLLDLQGLVYTLGRPDAPTTYSLDGEGIVINDPVKSLYRKCKVCKEELPPLVYVCPNCGKDHTPKVPKVIDTALEEWEAGWEQAKKTPRSRMVLALAGMMHKAKVARRDGKEWKAEWMPKRFRMIFRRDPYPQEIAAAKAMVREIESFAATSTKGEDVVVPRKEARA